MDFGSLRTSLTRMGMNTAQKAKDFSEITKLNASISSSEKEINQLYSQIGYQIFCNYRDNPIPEVADMMEQVHKLHEYIAQCKNEIEEINNTKTCPNCGSKVLPTEKFCSTCGYSLKDVEADAAETVPEEPANEPSSKVCSQCGATIDSAAQYCDSCGAKVE